MGLHPNGFQDRRVMTTSLTLRIFAVALSHGKRHCNALGGKYQDFFTTFFLPTEVGAVYEVSVVGVVCEEVVCAVVV